MSKNANTILIILGIFVVLAGICVVGIGVFTYRFVDTTKIFENQQKGAEFGRTTDNTGCETKGYFDGQRSEAVGHKRKYGNIVFLQRLSGSQQKKPEFL